SSTPGDLSRENAWIRVITFLSSIEEEPDTLTETSSSGGGSIFFRRRTAGLFRIIRRLRAITVLNPDRTRVFAVRRMMLHPITSNTTDTSALRNPGPWTHL